MNYPLHQISKQLKSSIKLRLVKIYLIRIHDKKYSICTVSCTWDDPKINNETWGSPGSVSLTGLFMPCLGSDKLVVAKTKVFIYCLIVKQCSKPTWISSFTQQQQNYYWWSSWISYQDKNTHFVKCHPRSTLSNSSVVLDSNHSSQRWFLTNFIFV